MQTEEQAARKVSYHSAGPIYIHIALQAARSRVEKATAAAHARQRATFNPQAQASQPKQKQQPQRRVALILADNAHTGEVVGDAIGATGKRMSKRRHTILNTSAHVRRMKRSEEKKVRCYIYQLRSPSSPPYRDRRRRPRNVQKSKPAP